MAEHYSPLRYPGGKAVLSEFLISLLKHNRFTAPHYVEPYAGGAGAALRLLFEEYAETITINDADPRISSFWIAVTKYNEQFIDLVQNVELSVDEWRRQRAVYEGCSAANPLRLGFATFYLNRTTRSGIVHNGGPIGGYDQTGNYKIDARFNKDPLCERIRRIGIFSDRIEVSCEDGNRLLQRINSEHGRERDYFVYIDPPYYVKGAELYMNRFSDQEHRQLSSVLTSGVEFPWIMTYDDVPPIRELYSDLPQAEFYLSYSAYKRRKGKEVLIWPPGVKVPLEVQAALPAVA
ncbi:DNA adenine methylase [Billgrantia antri]|uniref:DNA adenine methylase n=1 Tax=Billgrantia antri TaxID=2846777 RepID=A0ABS6ZNS8_9GAMM|nr:DNA adenine methylase [Halomonas antri]MBW6391112.1 DNA adenine methylase [Halomonas antri]